MTDKNNPGMWLPVGEHHFDPLAVERTELALERTHLSWIRTVIALITSGFAIDKLVDAFREKRLISGETFIEKAHITGLVLTITGSALMLFVTAYYIKRSKELSQMRKGRLRRILPGMILSVFIFMVGIVLIYLVAKS